MTELEELEKQVEELKKKNAALIRIAGKPQKIVSHIGVFVESVDNKLKTKRHYQPKTGRQVWIPAVPYIDVEEA